MIHRFVKRTPKPKATKKRRGLFEEPLPLLELVDVGAAVALILGTTYDVVTGVAISTIYEASLCGSCASLSLA